MEIIEKLLRYEVTKAEAIQFISDEIEKAKKHRVEYFVGDNFNEKFIHYLVMNIIADYKFEPSVIFVGKGAFNKIRLGINFQGQKVFEINGRELEFRLSHRLKPNQIEVF